MPRTPEPDEKSDADASSRPSDLESALLAELNNYRGPALPSVRSLSRYLSVSRGALVKVLEAMQRDGRLKKTPTGRLRRGDALSAPAVAPDLRGSEAVIRRIREGIQSGEYRHGSPLPKLAVLAREWRVSAHSLLRAFRQMAQEGLLHRQGRAWAVGARAEKTAFSAKSNPAAVLLLMPKPHVWHSLDASSRTRGFCLAFSGESIRHGVRHVPVLMQRSPYFSGLFPFGPAGLLETAEGLARQLGVNWLGTLMIGKQGEIPDFADWVRLLSPYRRPILWFDSIDEGLTTPVPGDARSGPAGRPQFLRCHYSEVPGIRLVVKHLASKGHRVAGYAYGHVDPWMENRFHSLRREASVLAPSLEIFSLGRTTMLENLDDVKELERRWRTLDLEGPPLARARMQDMLRQAGVKSSRGLYARLAREIPGLVPARIVEAQALQAISAAAFLEPYLNRPGLTALIAPNDFRAGLYYRWLRQMAVRVPEQVSLVSFDNVAQVPSSFLINTVDWGFDHLGYWAFHALLGQLPLPGRRRGELAAVPRLVDRNSVAEV